MADVVGGGTTNVTVYDENGNPLGTTSNPLTILDGSALIPKAYDSIALAYTGNLLTGVTYKAAATTVATLTLGYTNGLLTSVARS